MRPAIQVSLSVLMTVKMSARPTSHASASPLDILTGMRIGANGGRMARAARRVVARLRRLGI